MGAPAPPVTGRRPGRREPPLPPPRRWLAMWLPWFAPAVADTSSWTQRLDHGSFRGFPTFEEATSMLEGWLQSHPKVFTKEEIGMSYEQRPILAYRLAFGEPSGAEAPDGARPQVLLTALMHSREPASLTCVLYIIGHLLELYSAGDPLATYVVERRELWIIPFVNPDGYIANQLTPNRPVIRKNRRPTCANKYESGVDINRNFPVAWQRGQFPMCGEEYQGTAPFSEPETQAIKSICDRKAFKAAMNFHTFGSMLTHPYNFAPTPDKARLKVPDDNHIYEELQSVFKFDKFGPAIKTVGYTAPGESDDWLYSEKGIISMSPEVGPESGNFFPPAKEIAAIDSRNFDRAMHLVVKSGLQLSTSWKRGAVDDEVLVELQNAGMSPSAGEAVGVAISGLGDAAAVTAEDGPVAASVSSTVLAFKVPPLPRRSRRSLRIRPASSEGSATLCALEAGAGVCQCLAASGALSGASPGLPTLVSAGATDALGTLCAAAAAALRGASTTAQAQPAPAPAQPAAAKAPGAAQSTAPPARAEVATPAVMSAVSTDGPATTARPAQLGLGAVAAGAALLALLAIVGPRLLRRSSPQEAAHAPVRAEEDEEEAAAINGDDGANTPGSGVIGPRMLGARAVD